jgi:hypothetical protein
MAQKYIVQEKDNPLTLAKKFEMSPQALLANNGIKTLTAGQTIKVPTNGGLSGDKQGKLEKEKTNGPFVVNQNPLFKTNTTQAQGSFVSGSGKVNLAQMPRSGNIPQNITNGGYIAQNGAYVSTQQQTNIHNQVPIFGQVTTNQLQQQIQQEKAQAAPQIPARPQGVFTGDPNDPNTAQWRNYWNWQAANPNLVPKAAPIVMTRDQVWNMKAAQRRREGGGGNVDPYQPYYEPFYGNNVVEGSFRG